MPVVYVIHAREDERSVRGALIPPLPALGFDRWVSAAILSRRAADSLPWPEAIANCAVVLAVVSDKLSGAQREEFSVVLRSGKPRISVRLGAKPASLDSETMTLPAVTFERPDDATDPRTARAWRDLADLLPSPGDSVVDRGLSAIAEPIDWNEQIFSQFLEDAVSRHDYNRGNALVNAFVRNLEDRRYAYPSGPANRDLGLLRAKRQFTLMRPYAEAVRASGTDDFKVRRQYGQALIELGAYGAALKMLRDIIGDAPAKHPERYEARGLVGRAYKQQYVDAPEAPGAHTLLRNALDAYQSVFEEDVAHVWHGINAASLILRASREGIDGPDPARARDIATAILSELQRRLKEKTMKDPSAKLDVWDYATRVEASLALGKYWEADIALNDYLAHPDMDAFEVSSTHRQFEEVLQLDKDPKGQPLLDRLWQAVERYRAPRSLRPGEETPSKPSVVLPMLARVTDPAWEPVDVPDIVLHARLGTVISISGSKATVRKLLKDPAVVSVEESRPSSQLECRRSVPFIRVANAYPGTAGSFSEKGAHALVAIIDEGIDVLHGAFTDDHGQSRIVGIWDQTDSSGPPPPGFSFGTYHTQHAIAGYVASAAVPPALGRNNDGHGTHVTSIAAGRAVGTFAGGVAPESRVLIIIAPPGELIGYSRAHLEALQFIGQTATVLDLPVVVNVSQGMNAGAHDGRSALEVAFNEFSNYGRAPGRIIVKSAGNERDKNGHAKVTLLAGGAEELRWACLPDPFLFHQRLELWWTSANQFRFRMRGPSGGASAWVDEAAPNASGIVAGSAPFRLQLVKRHVDNGDSQLTIEIGDGVALVPPGKWALDIVSGTVPEAGDIHAWIERGGSIPSGFLNHASEEMTLSIPGTADSVITVGAVEAAMPVMVGDFSSYGPTRDGRPKPDVAAPGVHVEAAKGGTADQILAMDGTSMAAPHVTGAIALLLSKVARSGRTCPTSTQIASALRQKTINYSARWDRGLGFGVVDVAALLAAF
jgi:endonuclease G